KRLDAHAVQSRSAIEQHWVLVNAFFENVPHFGIATLQHLFGRLDRVSQAVLLEPTDNERLIELQRDLLGKAALMQLEFRPDDNDRTRGVVDALAEQVFAEAALLALDHVGQRLQRTVGRAQHRAAAAAVVKERIDRLLEHSLLVANDDFGRVEIDELLQAV